MQKTHVKKKRDSTVCLKDEPYTSDMHTHTAHILFTGVKQKEESRTRYRQKKEKKEKPTKNWKNTSVLYDPVICYL